MKFLICALLLLFGSIGAMEDKTAYMPIHIDNLKKTISVVGDEIEAKEIIRALLDYFKENSLKFVDLWYEEDGKQRHFALDILELTDIEFIKACAKTFSEMLVMKLPYGKNGRVITYDVLLKSEFSRLPISPEKRRIQSLYNELRDIQKSPEFPKVRLPARSHPILRNREKQQILLSSKPKTLSKYVPTRSGCYISDEYGDFTKHLIGLIKSENQEIKMVYSRVGDLKIAEALRDARDRGVAITLILNFLPENKKVAEKLSSVKIKKLDQKERLIVLNVALFEELGICAYGSWFPACPEDKLLASMQVESNDNIQKVFKRTYAICEEQSNTTLSISDFSEFWGS